MIKLTLKTKKALYQKWVQLNKPDVKTFAEAHNLEYASMLAIIAKAEG